MSNSNSTFGHTKTKDYTGLVFGRLTAITRIPERGKKTKYLCACLCGNTCVVKGNSLVTNHTRSCGCLVGEGSHWTHGMSKSPEYEAFMHMWSRTTNPNNKDYEAYKGRTPPSSWRDFGEFFAELGPRPSSNYSLDRIDNDKPYAPGNVRWATSLTQANNSSKNVAIEFQGEIMNVSEWARVLGVPADAIYGRLRRGWDGKRALAEPIGVGRPSGERSGHQLTEEE